MTNEKLYSAIGNINDEYILKAEKYKKPVFIKYIALAACLSLILTSSIIYFNFKNQPVDFIEKVSFELGETYEDETGLQLALINLGERTACYIRITYIDNEKLSNNIGEEYKNAKKLDLVYNEQSEQIEYKINENIKIFSPLNTENIKYLIFKDGNNNFELWKFYSFEVEEGEHYTYGDVLRIIYNVDNPDDIKKIQTRPIAENNTEKGKKIQKEIGVRNYIFIKDIEIFYNIAEKVVCYGAEADSKANNKRFEYSFSTDANNKIASEEKIYGSRSLKITLVDGTTIDSWKYNALSGSFYEYGVPATEPLTDEDVYKLNKIFSIK